VSFIEISKVFFLFSEIAQRLSLVHTYLPAYQCSKADCIGLCDTLGSNLLVNRLGELKLADFGLARLFQKKVKRDYTNRVITLWYRPPELILGATAYGPEVDMWSAGCIMVELFTGKPIFQGHNEITQLEQIWRIMGTPQKESWPDVDQLPWYELVKHVSSETRAPRFRESFAKCMTPAALDLAEALLSLNPKRRPSAVEALTKFAYFVQEEPVACNPEEYVNNGGNMLLHSIGRPVLLNANSNIQFQCSKKNLIACPRLKETGMNTSPSKGRRPMQSPNSIIINHANTLAKEKRQIIQNRASPAKQSVPPAPGNTH